MTIPQQALHVFKKDVRHLRWEIAALLGLAVFLLWFWTDSWSGETSDEFVERGTLLTGPYLAVAWFLVLARLLQAEPLVGDDHFWLTRPYSRSALLLAKAAFAVAFVLLPLLMVQVLAVVLSGLRPALGALLVNQVLVAAIICLPAAAIAAVTRDLRQYVLVTLIGGAGVGASWANTVTDPVPYLAGAVLLGACSLAVLIAQHRGRRTLRNAAAYFAACAAIGLLVNSFPRDLTRALEHRLDRPRAAGGLSFGIGPPSAVADGDPFYAAPGIPAEILLPLEASGADFSDLVLASPTVTLQTASGERLRVSARVSPQTPTLRLLFASGALNRVTSQPVTLHAEVWVKRFSTVTATLPNDGSPILLDGREQCRAVQPSGGSVLQPRAPVVMCRHASSATPWRELDLQVAPANVADSFNFSRTLFSRAMVPTIDPIADVRIGTFVPLDSSTTGPELITVVRRERVSFGRVSFDAENLRLADYLKP